MAGIFITFEGTEGCGKSTHIKKLATCLKEEGHTVRTLREPGGTESGEEIRELLKHGPDNLTPEAELLLMNASRAQLVREIIRPALAAGEVVLCDRFFDSTLAYQVYGKGVDKNFINSIHKKILKGIKPNLTIILKANINKAMKRLKKRKNKNRYDKFSSNFYRKVQNAFIKISKTNSKRYIILDNSNDTPVTEKIIFSKFMKLLDQ